MVRQTERITKGGQTLSARVWALIEDAKQAAGIPAESARVVQGSWSTSVAQSAGTHSGGGAFDLSVKGLTFAQVMALVDQLRRRNADAWFRSPSYGWPKSLGGSHVHGVVKDEPGLSKGARAQVAAYDLCLNGLANKHRDPFSRPPQAPFFLFGDRVPWQGDTLKLGSKGPAVKALQLALEIEADGIYGPATKARVRRFQLTRPKLWPADGVCGPQTYATAIEWGWR